MNITILLTLAPLILLLVLSAFFSGAETSLTSISKVELRQIKKNKAGRNKTIAKVLSDPSRMITTLLIGNNITNIWSSSIATAFAINLFGAEGVGIATAVMTVFIIIFSEILPKTIAAASPSKTAHRLSPAVLLIERILFPVYALFSGINNALIYILRFIFPDSEHRLTEDELKTMIEVGKTEGVLEDSEHTLLKRAFTFTDLKLREIMTPRTSITAISSESLFSEVKEKFRQHQFSRMPVFDGSIDSIRGCLHYKDILFLEKPFEGAIPEHLIRPILFVPETKGLFELLAAMESRKQDMAIIIDEHGGTVGLVTLDDTVAAVFGGINDEYDTSEKEPIDLVQILDTTTFRLPGNLKLSDMNTLLKLHLDSEYYETVGGFVLEIAGRLPEKGEIIQYRNLAFSVTETQGRKIAYIDVNIRSTS